MKAQFVIVVAMTCAAAFGDAFEMERINARAREIVAKMTLREKVNEMTLATGTLADLKRQFDAGACGHVISALSLADRRAIQEYVIENSRLRIPTTFQADVIHGYRVIAPIPLASACSWDDALIEEAESAAAQEACWFGETLTYAPMVDIADDPRWGRVMETSGEDPYLSGRLAAARVRGFQGRTAADLASNRHILACGKHFLGYAASYGGVDCRMRDFSKREVYETFLVPYRWMIDAGLASVMCSYTGYDATYSTFSPGLRDLLRNELKFDGVYMTDWDTFAHAYRAGVSSSPVESARRAICEGGIGLSMFNAGFTNLIEFVRRGEVKEELIDREAVRSIAMKIRAGLFEDPFGRGDPTKTNGCDAAVLATVRGLAGESIVLLKNNGVLPLALTNKVWVCGPYADERAEVLGQWAQSGRPEDTVTVREGMERAWGYGEIGWSGDTCKLEWGADTVVYAFGEPRGWSGEGPARGSLELPRDQLDELKRLKATGRKVVAVVFAGRPVLLGEVLANCDALLYAWFPGTTCGDAVADIVSGKVNPSAKLSQTIPRAVGQVPLTYRKRRQWIGFGYVDIPNDPEFPFGFGLSYTTFAYSKPRVVTPSPKAGEAVRVEVDVTNTGAREGREVVQVYVRDEKASVLTRERELKEYASVTLKPGERRTVSFNLTDEAFALYDVNCIRTVEPGDFTVFIGPDSSTTNSVTVHVKDIGRGASRAGQ